MKQALKTALSAPALEVVSSFREIHELTLSGVRGMLETPDSSLTQIVNGYAESIFLAEGALRWARIVERSIERGGAEALATLLADVEDSLDSWTPTNSTSLLARLEGDVELKTLRTVRSMLVATVAKQS